MDISITTQGIYKEGNKAREALELDRFEYDLDGGLYHKDGTFIRFLEGRQVLISNDSAGSSLASLRRSLEIVVDNFEQIEARDSTGNGIDVVSLIKSLQTSSDN